MMMVVASFQMTMHGVGSKTRHSCRISYRCGPARASTLEMQIRSTAAGAYLGSKSLLQAPKRQENGLLSLETYPSLDFSGGLFGLGFLISIFAFCWHFARQECSLSSPTCSRKAPRERNSHFRCKYPATDKNLDVVCSLLAEILY